ncbi:tripartite tricarboxylate transporter TctB family protein [Nocardioides coralli]|uniref:tripartite tricarboxylate transporter TctB family protein n=1 Tax=Nocardioides coralli TaxID=2872154 RepID=UPI001CA3B1F8|nr:tripartite tricarboxylate transporter TctB family protein [Nocardioides coralli]QZY29497.1 tripartite tricarboxylate transporter TctB family protein [Nocardioides coralli]
MSTTHSSGSPAGVRAGRTTPAGELLFAGGVAALGVFALVRAGAINEPITAGSMGPRTLPYLVGGALVVAGLAVAVAVLRGHRGEAEEGEDVADVDHTDWATVGMLVGLLVLHIFLIVPAGWPVAATFLFAGSAVVLGARPWWRTALVGLALSLVLQVAFAGGLGVSLPAGPLLEGVPFLDG